MFTQTLRPEVVACLVSALNSIVVGGKVRVDEAEGGIKHFEADCNPSFVALHTGSTQVVQTPRQQWRKGIKTN